MRPMIKLNDPPIGYLNDPPLDRLWGDYRGVSKISYRIPLGPLKYSLELSRIYSLLILTNSYCSKILLRIPLGPLRYSLGSLKSTFKSALEPCPSLHNKERDQHHAET